MDGNYEGYWKKPKLQYYIQQMLHRVTRRELSSSLHTTQRAVLTTASAPGAAVWLYAAPWKGYTLTNAEYRVALRIRLGLRQTNQLNGPSGTCCKGSRTLGDTVDELLHHGLSCGQSGSAATLRVRRHDAIALELAKFLKLAQMDVEREMLVDAKKPGEEKERMDLVVKDPLATIFIDVSVTNPLTDNNMSRSAAKPLAAAADKENRKRKKYHHLLKANTEVLPFILEATGGFGEGAAKFPKRVARKIPASRLGIREARNFRKLSMAKLSITLMRENIKQLDSFQQTFQPLGEEPSN